MSCMTCVAFWIVPSVVDVCFHLPWSPLYMCQGWSSVQVVCARDQRQMGHIYIKQTGRKTESKKTCYIAHNMDKITFIVSGWVHMQLLLGGSGGFGSPRTQCWLGRKGGQEGPLGGMSSGETICCDWPEDDQVIQMGLETRCVSLGSDGSLAWVDESLGRPMLCVDWPSVEIGLWAWLDLFPFRNWGPWPGLGQPLSREIQEKVWFHLALF